jgi:osmoprotectant transport system ATP-binding protein
MFTRPGWPLLGMSSQTTASGTASGDSIIEFRAVSYSACSNGAKPILDGISLAIRSGETVVLLGKSGAGKTTLLKLVNRMLIPSRGEVFVEGRATAAWDVIRLRRGIGYVIQHVGLFPHFNVKRNVTLVPNLEKWPKDREEKRYTEVMELVGLDPREFARRLPHQLSGGQRQRVGVARALAADPPILLMDEPFGALDPLTRADLHAEFRRIQLRLRKTVIIVTHDMGEAFALANRIGVVEEGVLVACDRPEAMAASRDPRVRRLLDAVPTVPRPQAESL